VSSVQLPPSETCGQAAVNFEARRLLLLENELSKDEKSMPSSQYDMAGPYTLAAAALPAFPSPTCPAPTAAPAPAPAARRGRQRLVRPLRQRLSRLRLDALLEVA
jgi:hypothetical protein